MTVRVRFSIFTANTAVITVSVMAKLTALPVIVCLWTVCGLAAFATHLVRRRLRDANWCELVVLTIATAFVGPIALLALIKDDHTEI